MFRKIVLSLFIAFSIFGCDLLTMDDKDDAKENNTTVNQIVAVTWKGSLPIAPEDPEIGWAYYNTTDKKSYVWDGDSWEILAQDGISIIWKGELPAAPNNPEINWAYYNIIDGNSYIWTGSGWHLLAKSGRDGASGILLWLGPLDTAPPAPEAGWAYYNTSSNTSYIWDGDSWEILARDGTNGTDGVDGTNGVGILWKGALTDAPASPALNWAYFNTDDNTGYIWDGDSWEILTVSGSSTITVPVSWKGSLTAAPINPQIGWMYYNSLLGKSYIWDGSAWNIVAQNGTSPAGFLITWKGGLSGAPGNPQQGWAYYNTTQKKSYIWDGSTWQILAQDGADGTGGGGVVPSTYLYVLVYTSTGNYFESVSQSIGTVDFGKVGLGSTIRTTTFYISLQGSSGTTLNLTGSPAIQLSGANADCFSVTQPSTTSTTTGTYIMDASIAFTPNSLGLKTATITIPNNSPDKPNFSFTITGTGSLWPKTYDSGEGDGDDRITCSVEDSQGNIYFIGYGFELVNHHSGYDWWIKKINSSGNEVTSGWNKKIDTYDNYSTSTSDTHDKPTNAIVDGNNSLIVSDGYYTIKFTADGTEAWRKDTGGTLYVDSQNNVFVATSTSIAKYNSSGTLLWSKAYGGTLAFDSSDNIAVASGDNLRYISASGTENWAKFIGDVDTNVIATNGWYNGYISTGSAEYWRLSVENGKSYSVSWNDSYQGDGTKTCDVYVTAYRENDNTSIFTRTDSGWNTSKTFSSTESGTVIFKVDASSSSSGTYAIEVTDWYTNGASITSGWYDSSLSTNGSETRVIPVTAGKRYFIAWNDTSYGDGTKTAKVYASAYWQDDESSIVSRTTNGWSSPKNFLATKTGNVVVKIETYSSSASYAGTYGVVVKEAVALSCDKIIAQTIRSAVFDSSGNIYTAGYGTNWIDAYSKKDVWIKKFNSSGTEITSGWNKKYDWGHSDDEAATKILFRDGNIIVIGQGNDLVNGSSKDDTWVKKFNTSGTELTSFVIPDNSAALVKLDSSNNFYFSSNTSSITTAMFSKYNSTGTSLYSYLWNSKSPYMYPPIYIMDSSNNIYMYGYATNLMALESGNDWIIRKFNSAGVEQ